MAIRKVKPINNATRHLSYLETRDLSKVEPQTGLITILKKHSGRNNSGRVTVRHRGGRQKRFYRLVDFKRTKHNIISVVATIEYDPNRTANIALLHYADGEKSYILAPDTLKIGDKLMSSETAEIKPGNATLMKNIPLGMAIHNLELRAGKGGQIIRSAGSAAYIQSKEDQFANVLLPSGEVRRISLTCYATIGQVSNADWSNISLGKAGRKRNMGWRPSVRGVAMAPNSHPHGGGEGRSGIGMSSPKSVYGKKTMGVKTRKKTKYSDKLIIKRRRAK